MSRSKPDRGLRSSQLDPSSFGFFLLQSQVVEVSDSEVRQSNSPRAPLCALSKAPSPRPRRHPLALELGLGLI
jgi:hypothetical protein